MRGIIRTLRYRVISATHRDATAQVDGDNDTSAIEIGNLGTFIEDGSEAASARRFKRKRLPLGALASWQVSGALVLTCR